MQLEELKQQIKEKGTKSLIKEKIKKSKSVPKTGDSISYNTSVHNGDNVKIEKLNEVEEIEVEVVANMAMFMDSDNDVLSPTSWSKSVTERGVGNVIPFLKNHMHSTDGIIGKTVEFLDGKVNLTNLGYPDVEGDALIHRAKVFKLFDEQTFERYMAGVIKQHSIGLQYVQLDLAINEPEYEDEFKVWRSQINNIINKEETEKAGYFWWVTEIKLIENSAVLFGANSLTPTLSIQTLSNSTVSQGKSFYKSLIQKG